MLICVTPRFDELSYRQKWMEDERTMSYNKKYGGTIPFPKDRWRSWYEKWIIHPEKKFYAYLYSEYEKDYVGEIAYHFDEEYGEIIASIIIEDKYRKKGYGKEGLRLLCERARKDGYASICDDIAADNPSVYMFLSEGFKEEKRSSEVIFVRKKLSE